MNSPTTPRIAPSFATQRSLKPVRNPTNGSKMNATAFSMSEAEAVERSKQGDGVAFETLYGLHKRRIYSLCLRMVASPAPLRTITNVEFPSSLA